MERFFPKGGDPMGIALSSLLRIEADKHNQLRLRQLKIFLANIATLLVSVFEDH
jgi:hypothetical protein